MSKSSRMNRTGQVAGVTSGNNGTAVASVAVENLPEKSAPVQVEQSAAPLDPDHEETEGPVINEMAAVPDDGSAPPSPAYTGFVDTIKTAAVTLNIPDPSFESVSISVPFAEFDATKNYSGRQYHLKLDHAQAQTLSEVRKALNASSMRMADGRHVEKPIHAIEWILDQIAAAKKPAAPSQV